MFIRLDKTPERDGQTDRQTAHRYYSGLHCEQCRCKQYKCAVKKVSPYLVQTKMCVILAYFCLTLVVVITPFAPLNIWIAYLN